MRRKAQARNPYSRSWLWVPGSRFARPGTTSRLRRVDEGPGRGLRIPGHLDDDKCGPAMRQGLFQRGAEMVGRSHAARRHAEGFRELDEIRIDEVGRHHAAVETLALVAPHIAVGIVVEHQRHHADVELHRGRKLRYAEHE